MNQQALFSKIRGAQEEWAVAALAVGRLHDQARTDPSVLKLKHEILSIAGIKNCLDHLEATYIVRLFAEFEAALRTYWRSAGKQRRAHTRHLIDKTASRHYIPADWLDRVHQVRECRNRLVHEQTTGPELTLSQCRSHLCRFLSALPHSS